MYLCYSWNSESPLMRAFICYMENVGIPLVNAASGETVDRLEETSLYTLNQRITKEKYVVLFLTDKLRYDVTSLVELNEIQKKLKKHKIKVFTIAAPEELDNLPKWMQWVTMTTVIPVTEPVDIHKAVLQIADIYYHDLVSEMMGEEESDAYNLGSMLSQDEIGKDPYVQLMMQEYSLFDQRDIVSKMTILYALYSYMDLHGRLIRKSSYYKCILYFHRYSGQCLPANPVQLSIMENCFILSILETMPGLDGMKEQIE